MDRTTGSLSGGAQQAQNPFFRSLNQGYGEGWQASAGVNPLNMQETPEYKDLVSISLFLFRNSNHYETSN